MIRKFTMGSPIYTGAVIKSIDNSDWKDFPFRYKSDSSFVFDFQMEKDEVLYGLGESTRGINKRGWIYESWCSDDPFHTEGKRSLYAAHNFIIKSGIEGLGIFIDFPSKITWNLGYSDSDKAEIIVDGKDFDIYIITGDSPLNIVKEFRKIIGKSYTPPFWAFGFQQSRWGYYNQDDVNKVIDGYNNADIPLDCVYLDIDYMDHFKDFTVDDSKFPDFENYIAEKKKAGIRLIPIIDAGIKKENGYDIYEEGRENGYFCKNADGGDFEAGVWPGICNFPDFMREDVRNWFGSKYRKLIDMGIEGFWNDMNEPALFYTADRLNNAIDKISELKGQDLDIGKYFSLNNTLSLSNRKEDYESFYHNIDGRNVNHSNVHNIYGACMTRAAGEYFEKEYGKGKILMFSRASYIGAHRYGGIWFGDNHSWWSHILLCLKMLPGANMCGFLYCGADLGGFNENSTRDLVLRFLALGVFTPLMRNHSALGTKNQECFVFGNSKDFRDIIQVRYRLIPYLYHVFKKAEENDDMIFRPLSFDYPEDKIARECETQLMLGDECMIAPVYEQNAFGRTVYLPEDMTFVLLSGENVSKQNLSKGLHYINADLNEVPLFIKKGKKIPLCRPALRTSLLDTDDIEYIS